MWFECCQRSSRNLYSGLSCSKLQVPIFPYIWQGKTREKCCLFSWYRRTLRKCVWCHCRPKWEVVTTTSIWTSTPFGRWPCCCRRLGTWSSSRHRSRFQWTRIYSWIRLSRSSCFCLRRICWTSCAWWLLFCWCRRPWGWWLWDRTTRWSRFCW